MHALHAFDEYLSPAATIMPNGFVRIVITPAMMQAAIAAEGKLTPAMAERGHKNSIRRGEGNLAGCLGEQAFIAALIGAESQNTFQHDVGLLGLRVEVKSKDRSVAPHPHFMASVCDKNTTQNADVYAFVSLMGQNGGFSDAYICGLIAPEDFYELAAPMGKGEMDPTGLYDPKSLKGTGIKEDCWNLPYGMLLPAL